MDGQKFVLFENNNPNTKIRKYSILEFGKTHFWSSLVQVDQKKPERASQ
jgi:hypothetical protein